MERLCVGWASRLPPVDHVDGHCVRPQAQRIETEMIFQLVPQELTDLKLAGTGTEPLEQGGEQAVVLVLHIVSNADGIPLIEQTPQIILSGRLPGSHGPILPPTIDRFRARSPDPNEFP